MLSCGELFFDYLQLVEDLGGRLVRTAPLEEGVALFVDLRERFRQRAGAETVKNESLADLPARRLRSQNLTRLGASDEEGRFRALRVSLAAASNSERASASRPTRNRKSPRAAGSGA